MAALVTRNSMRKRPNNSLKRTCADAVSSSSNRRGRAGRLAQALGPVIERCISVEHPGWLALREALWPGSQRKEHLAEMASFLVEPKRFLQLVAKSSEGMPIGLAEASIRSDYVNGTATSPVAFLEGLFVVPEQRGKGVATALVVEVVSWARVHGCRELASDAPIKNEASQAVHRALGFRETERVVYFSRPLT